MRTVILLYGLVGGVLVVLLKWVEYRFLIVNHSFELYAGLVAAVFAALGVWLGLRLTRPKPEVREVVREVEVLVQVPVTSAIETKPEPADAFVRDEHKVAALGLTPRELQILEWIALGLSNKEIAALAFVSENTVKTHSSRIFDKLGAKRRTQAVQLGKDWRLIP